MHTHFMYDPLDGFSTFPSAEEAKAACEKAFDDYKDEAAEGWNEEVDSLCWGAITEVVTITKRTARPPADQLDESNCDAEGNYWSGDFDELVERELVPLAPNDEDATSATLAQKTCQ